MEVKTCSKCGEQKPVSAFPWRSKARGKLQPHCKPCKNSRAKVYYLENAEERRQKKREYESENKDLVLLRQKKMREKDPEKFRARSRRYQKNNPGVVNARNAKRYTSLKSRSVAWADEDAIRAFYEEAARLEQETGIKHHVDHIIPLQGELVSGLHVENNLQVIPANENLSKSNHYEVA